jgi:hypothetical protein
MESQGLGIGGPAVRCGLPFRGNGRPIRDAGFSKELSAKMVGGALIEVRWLPDVLWRSRIRLSKPKYAA